MSDLKNIANLLMSGDLDGAATAIVDRAAQKLNENFETYHKLYSDAVSEALRLARDDGYEVDEEEIYQQITVGPRKPDVGKENSFSLALTKNGKPVKERLQFQIYGLDSGRYELNAYIW